MKAYRFTLADDDPNMLFLMHYMLSHAFPHSSIASFSSAEDALRHILDTGTDILITDHAMGSMNGAQLVRRLRDLKSEIPIIMISGNPAAREEAHLAGATEFLDKRVGMKVLEATVRSLIHAWGPEERP